MRYLTRADGCISLGNVHQIPKKGAHFQFSKWAKQYGEIYTLKLGTGTAAVITSKRLVKELTDKKSSIYSERPKSYVAKLISGGDHILLMDVRTHLPWLIQKLIASLVWTPVARNT